jgi:hypothetical protein
VSELYITLLRVPERSPLEAGLSFMFEGDGPWVVGRSSSCDVTLKDPSVSREHAVLGVRDDTLSFENRSKANGLYVEGDEVAPGASVRVGAGSPLRVQVGKLVLRVERLVHTTPHREPIGLGAGEPGAPEPMLEIVRDGDCCVAYCRGRRIGLKPSSALALWALAQRPGQIVHQWDILDALAQTLDLAQAVSGARRGLRELLGDGTLGRDELVDAILETTADTQRAALLELDDAALVRHLVFSRRGHGYGLALPPELVATRADD